MDSVLISDWLEGAVVAVAVAPPPSSGNDGGDGEFRTGSMKTAGRLDKESEGLILLTDDGSFSRLLCDLEFGLGKTYRAVVRGSRGCGGCVHGGAAVAAEDDDDDDDDAGRRRLAGAVSDIIRRRDAAGVLPVEDRGEGPGSGHGTAEDEDHNNNTTIKQCTGEGGADDDGGDRQLAVGGWWR